MFDHAEVFRDRVGGILVVTGDHDGDDAGFFTKRDGFFGFFTRRVDHAGESDKGHVFFGFFRIRMLRRLVERADGIGEYTQCGTRKGGVLLHDLFSVGIGEFSLFAVDQPGGAAV